MKVALYLDKTNEHIEDLLLSYDLKGIKIKFLNPIKGEKGELAEADYILATNYLVTKEIIDAAPNLKLITRTGVGYENVDIAYARTKNIDVTIARGGNATSVAELVVSLMLNCYRKIIVLDRSTKEGKWQSWDYRHESFELQGKKIGVIGAGFIGKEVMKRIIPFDVNIIYYDVYKMKPEDEEKYSAKYCELEELLSSSDIITIHMPVLEGTVGFMGKREFSLMKKNSFFINTARGQLVDEDALIWALDNKVIAGAALDVFIKNPPDSDSPLLKFPNVIATPHIGGGTIDAYRKIFKMCIDNIQKVYKNETPDFIVNK
ncbi:phosphoglycerate dehydrogenase [Sedimentibacter saalensis]|uniref:phosphoglycerate dehydrogenase n=1 Tax=Sedimentibacter saalensis TaxID=130788 RepID=UPI0028986C60|nr:phosphoglycerate dehydrogenase [Sedimentibacter saalensis]